MIMQCASMASLSALPRASFLSSSSHFIPSWEISNDSNDISVRCEISDWAVLRVIETEAAADFLFSRVRQGGGPSTEVDSTSGCPGDKVRVCFPGSAAARGVADAGDVEEARGGTGETVQGRTDRMEGKTGKAERGNGGGSKSGSSESDSRSQAICDNVTPSMESLSEQELSPASLQLDMSEGRGDEDRTSAGNDVGTCMVINNDFAGAKSSSLNTLGLKGKIPVQEKEEARSCDVNEAPWGGGNVG